MWLRNPFELSAKAVVDALATRGVRVPSFPPPEYEPWPEGRTVYVSKEEVQPIVDVLNEKHPAGQWGFNVMGKPRRGRIHAEESIDVDAVVAQARERIRAKARPPGKPEPRTPTVKLLAPNAPLKGAREVLLAPEVR
jgi:hypothetical protein